MRRGAHARSDLAPYFDGLANQELRLPVCQRCGYWNFPARAACQRCRELTTYEWRAAGGQGEVWSYCVFHKAYLSDFHLEVPYTVIVVKLREGPRVVSNLLTMRDVPVRVGMPVAVRFNEIGGEPVIAFVAE